MPIKVPTITVSKWYLLRDARAAALSAMVGDKKSRATRKPASLSLEDAIAYAEKVFCESGENAMLSAMARRAEATVADLQKCRTTTCVNARFAMIWCLRNHLSWSGTAIAKFVGVDRTTVCTVVSKISKKIGLPKPKNKWAIFCNNLDDKMTQERTIRKILSLVESSFGMRPEALIGNCHRRTERFTDARMCVVYAMRKNRVSLDKTAMAMRISRESTVSEMVTKLANKIEIDQTLADQLRLFMEKIKVALDKK